MQPDETPLVLTPRRDLVVVVESLPNTVTVESRADRKVGFVLVVAPKIAAHLFDLPWTRMITSLVHRLKGTR